MPPHIIETPNQPADPITPTLTVDDDGVLWLDWDGVVERVGYIEDADVPRELRAEYERMLSDWRDAMGGGHEAEAHNAYMRAKR